MNALAKPNDKRNKSNWIGPKVRQACLALVNDGLTWQQAAIKANLSTVAMWMALQRPQVQRFIRQQREVLRNSMCGRNILVLGEIRDNSLNDNARVNAVKALEQLDDQEVSRGAVGRSPGLQIVIVQQSVATPLPKADVIEHES